jgi:hypothetical protein
MGSTIGVASFLCAVVLCALCGTVPAWASDEFIAGYTSAILQHEFNVTDAAVEVHDGSVLVTTKTLTNIEGKSSQLSSRFRESHRSKFTPPIRPPFLRKIKRLTHLFQSREPNGCRAAHYSLQSMPTRDGHSLEQATGNLHKV